jgi:N6-L-threonylcarbamoyladenine synthase
MQTCDNFDFSFSGLKTAVLMQVTRLRHPELVEGSHEFHSKDSSSSIQNDNVLDDQTIADIALETENAIVEVLVKKTIKAAQKYNVKSLLLGGGVAANQKLKQQLSLEIENCSLKIDLHVPPPSLCTDNAAMIGAAAMYNDQNVHWKDVAANPDLYFD